MNISEHSGESSCKRQENGDKSTETERPLKKARFAWQVKGKYHLKAERNDEIHYSSVDSAPEDATFLDSSDSEIETGSLREQNLEILGDYLLKQDFNTLDTVADSEIKKEDELRENLPYKRYLTIPCHVYDNNIHNYSSSSNAENLSIPLSMVYEPTSWLEDQCIARWQAMQMTKSFVDNSINRVLDTWLTTALPTEETENRFLALDVAEFVNNLPGDNTVENEGILMAISAHGLQNNSNSTTSESNLNSLQINQSSASSITFDDNNSDETETDRENNLWDTNKMCLCSDSVAINENKPTTDQKSESILSSTSSTQSGDSSSSGQQDDCMDMEKYYQQYENVSSYSDELYTDQFDFMDAAVSFAIQNKGLTSYGTDYG